MIGTVKYSIFIVVLETSSMSISSAIPTYRTIAIMINAKGFLVTIETKGNDLIISHRQA
jgi:hypothetical protein